MDFEFGRARNSRAVSWHSWTSACIPAEAVWPRAGRRCGDPARPPARDGGAQGRGPRRGLWNLFLPDEDHGAGLSNCDYAPLAEIMGRTKIASEACNCAAPDTGNMEVLHQFGTDEQKERWLTPLLDGEIRSAFAMTEPDVASADATNIEMRIDRDGDDYVLNGRKWWITNALHPNLRILIVMGKTDRTRPPTSSSRWCSCRSTLPGVTIVRGLPVFGYHDAEGHGELEFTDVRVPVENL